MSDLSVKLNTGFTMPLLGYGTFLSKKGEVGPAVELALKTGYRHIDCAAIYENEAEIGAVFESVFNPSSSFHVPRESVFITSKLWVDNFAPSKVRGALEKTLSDLKLKYLDLYLMHVPVSSDKIDGKYVATKRAGYTLLDTWKALEACKEAGLVRSIGISNFPAALLNDLQNGAKILPAVHQIETHPYLQQTENIQFNKSLGVELTAYAPLGAPDLMKGKYGAEIKPLLENDTIVAIAKKHNVSTSQVLIRWSLDRAVSVIPKSVTPARIVSNFNVSHFKLDSDDMAAIAKLECGHRTFAQGHLGVPVFL